MVNNQIVFPVLELTDWIFEGEKVLNADFGWGDGIHRIKEKDFEKHYQRVLVDCKGNILKVTGNKVLKKEGALLSFIIPPTLVVEFDLELTGRTMSLNELKNKILSRSSENFNITYNKEMTVEEYNNKIRAAKTYEELIRIAAFVDEE